MSSTPSNAVVSSVIGRIYDSAVDPRRWEDTLAHLYPLLRCANAALELVDIRTSRVLLHTTVGIPEEYERTITDYAPDVVAMWGGWEQLIALPLEEPAVLSRVRSPEALANSRYLLEWGRPQGLFDLIGIGLARDASAMGSLGMGRHRSAGPVTDEDVATARLFIPHLQRAMGISRLLELKAVEARTLEATLDAVATGIVLVGRDLRIVHANTVAQTMLNLRDPIAVDRGVLSVRNRVSDNALQLAVAQSGADEALLGRRGQGIPVRTASGHPAILHVLPLARGDVRNSLSLNAAAAIFIAPGGASLPPPEQALSALFDLTPAEARVFTHASNGQTIAQTATALGVSATTVKTHLLRVYRKTDTAGQVDLMKLAGTLTLPLQAPG